jgi:undecaprenyl-diphosphatase
VSILHIVVLTLVQGVTEFLPISSSGHLVLVPIFTGWPDHGLIIDVAVHVGTLFAVILYFSRDIIAMLKGVVMAARGRKDPHAKLSGLLVLATIPVFAAGYGLKYYGVDGLRSLNVIAWTTLGFGVVLWISDKVGMTLRRVEHLGVSDAIIIGFAQVLALVPGTSRSGITMTAARILGMERSDAARFSMLLSIPTIIGAGALSALDLYRIGDLHLTVDAIFVAGLSFVTAMVAISFLMTWLRRSSFAPFAIYRIFLGGGLLGLSYGYFG